MLRFVLTAVLVSSLFGSAHAQLYSEPWHIGALCISCHDEFSIQKPDSENFSAPVKSKDVSQMYPCYKSKCHDATVKWGGADKRYKLHMRERICQNCHGKNGEFDIHKSHTIDNTTVNCNNCHTSLMGWNSTHVQVPPYEEIYVAESALLNQSIRVPDWGGDCGYCHLTLKNAVMQHDVHELVIEQACVDCHGEIIESVPNPLKQSVIGGEAVTPRVKVSLARSIMREYYILFENISLQLLNFYNFISQEDVLFNE